MPTTWIAGYAFRFYSSDGVEPPHVHVLKAGAEAKVWLDPVTLAYARRYNDPEVNRILALVEENRDTLLERWNEYFGR
ncbi:MAG: DUF4160 domain-containing protein [Dehalococcoidia bacterium]